MKKQQCPMCDGTITIKHYTGDNTFSIYCSKCPLTVEGLRSKEHADAQIKCLTKMKKRSNGS